MEVIANGRRASFQGDENVLELGNGDSCTTCEYTKRHLKMVNVMLYEL